ncbi:putative transcriptional regulator, PucR family [Xylanimonas cellulosilytica DSM 15894]|uniref:Transcriptional regulator, PucR family n=1 Tax=Xylanimonas cellulosilytica (strain DSM 15894 / JCM 12276 / CECT 5975 / KCTC 9989 / LMG 20990 / NBRC 107835 / XIL07) TaxID=446471 RepID=D1BUD9_XYLCX|nr:helix-turn-helix domain-containing protein [Xylanimonas cellulosilytica]ACZ31152.1 putative transcriptional regulator, PucR family [Xylanimonas cellulosilytica DSM 15894]
MTRSSTHADRTLEHRAATVQRVREGAGTLTNAALRRLDDELPWYRDLPAEDRSYVGMVAQSGIRSFVTWFADPSAPPSGVGEMFSAAPRELTQSISLQHTLQLVRLMVDVVESHAAEIAAPGAEREVREAVLRYSREVAFSAAEVYARAAEMRGAWDARLEALVVDALVRGDGDDAVRSRVSALGWSGRGRTLVIVGTTTTALDELRTADLRRAARRAAGDALVGIHGDRVVLVLGGEGDLMAAATSLLSKFGPGPVVIGGLVPSVAEASRSAAAALAGLAAAPAWPQAPRPVMADDLLPERVLIGDAAARTTLVEQAYRPLAGAGGAVLETLTAYLGTGRSLEAAARQLYVHPNTVRYRLRKVSEITGWNPLDARESFVLQVAMALGQLTTGA